MKSPSNLGIKVFRKTEKTGCACSDGGYCRYYLKIHPKGMDLVEQTGDKRTRIIFDLTSFYVNKQKMSGDYLEEFKTKILKVIKDVKKHKVKIYDCR